MVTGLNNILKTFELNNACYFRIKSSEKGSLIYSNESDSNKSTPDGVNDLREILTTIGAGNYFLDFWSASITAGKSHLGVNICVTTDNTTTTPVAGIGAVSKDEILEQIKKGISDYKLEVELDQLKKENELLKLEVKEKQSEIDGTLLKIGSKITPYIDLIAGRLIGGGAGTVSGIPTEPVTESEFQKRLETFFNSWNEPEEVQIVLLEGIVNLQKTSPETYNMAKNILTQKSE